MKDINNHIELDKLPKKQLYTVPDGYFEDLPGVIQNRVTARSEVESAPSFTWSPVLKFALPVAALVMMLVYFAVRFDNNDINIEAMIADIPTEELVDYLAESDISTDELLSLIDIDELDVDGMIEDDAELLNNDDLDVIMEEFTEFEFENEI
ncbi:MAG: hypothetical protein ABFS32_18120 [Bacteroidota bacterium]